MEYKFIIATIVVVCVSLLILFICLNVLAEKVAINIKNSIDFNFEDYIDEKIKKIEELENKHKEHIAIHNEELMELYGSYDSLCKYTNSFEKKLDQLDLKLSNKIMLENEIVKLKNIIKRKDIR